MPTFLSSDPTNPAIIDRPETIPMPNSLRLTINQVEEAALQESLPPNPVSQSELTNIRDKARFFALFTTISRNIEHGCKVFKTATQRYGQDTRLATTHGPR